VSALGCGSSGNTANGAAGGHTAAGGVTNAAGSGGSAAPGTGGNTGHAAGGTSTGGGAPAAGGTVTGGAGAGAAGGTTSGAANGGAGTSSGGASPSAGGTPQGAGGSAPGGSATGGSAGAGTCDPGSSDTTWATGCATAPATTCVAGTWTAAGSNNDGDTLVYESDHFAVYSNGAIGATEGQQATTELEQVIWPTYFGSPIFFPEPYCNSTTKYKASIVVHSDYGLTGGGWGNGYMGMWIGPGATADHWGLAHEFMHAAQAQTKGLDCGGAATSNYCGWIYESHANFMPHQLPEYRTDVHCSEMLFNAPHLYLGSTRDRYCNWQFMEYLKDKYCYAAVNSIWTASPKSNDPFTNIATTRGWSTPELNDFFGEWALHNITWDYVDPAPTVPNNPADPGAAFRSTYQAITDQSKPERRLRLTALDPLDDNVAQNRRFVTPYLWAPQRWGYNVVRLYPDAGVSSVTVTFRGVAQADARTDFRWSLVATDAGLTKSRYGSLQHGTDGELSFCVNPGEPLFLVVMATPSEQQHVYWDQPYPTIYRYPYMVAFDGAWPAGFQNGTQDACAKGTRWANGGGCVVGNPPSTVYVGPYAQILGGSVSGNARIEDHAVITAGTVADGTVGGLSILMNGFSVTGAEARASFYPLGFFEGSQSISGSTLLYGDIEFRGQGYSRTSGACSGYVDSMTCVPGGTSVNDMTAPAPYTWRD
jgi:hypothetical protein